MAGNGHWAMKRIRNPRRTNSAPGPPLFSSLEALAILAARGMRTFARHLVQLTEVSDRTLTGEPPEHSIPLLSPSQRTYVLSLQSHHCLTRRGRHSSQKDIWLCRTHESRRKELNPRKLQRPRKGEAGYSKRGKVHEAAKLQRRRCIAYTTASAFSIICSPILSPPSGSLCIFIPAAPTLPRRFQKGHTSGRWVDFAGGSPRTNP